MGTLLFLRKVTYIWLIIKLLEMTVKDEAERNTFGVRGDALEVRQVKWDVLFCSVQI